MNSIKLQNLTPDIYYNHSRDFQFIGRLFDIVLNSVKTSADSIYNLPFNANSDHQLIDLLTMTLGFKSKHNYNVKQLVALCSAFITVIKNKGNLKAITTAINTLLNAEGISENASCTLTNNNTTLNLFIPQKLTDLNLLKDLLIYILPAGMSCNITKELFIQSYSTTNLGTNDELAIYTNGQTDTNNTSIILKGNESGITNSQIKNTSGVMPNSWIYHIESGD